MNEQLHDVPQDRKSSSKVKKTLNSKIAIKYDHVIYNAQKLKNKFETQLQNSESIQVKWKTLESPSLLNKDHEYNSVIENINNNKHTNDSNLSSNTKNIQNLDLINIEYSNNLSNNYDNDDDISPPRKKLLNIETKSYNKAQIIQKKPINTLNRTSNDKNGHKKSKKIDKDQLEFEKYFTIISMGIKQYNEEEEQKNQKYDTLAQNEATEEFLKQKIRHEDPMANLMDQNEPKKHFNNINEINSIKRHNLMESQAKLNRFHIVPGLRWDAVDRSNGFERKIIQIENHKKSLIESQYRNAFLD